MKAGCIGSGQDPAERLREAAPEFDHLHNPTVAIDDGFRTRGSYVEDGLGEAFVHQDAVEIASADDLDPHRPTLLFAELTDAGEYDPLGVGWSIEASHVDGPPSLFGQSFHEPAVHLVPGQNEHYGLHAWVFAKNDVEDVFAPTYPSLSPPPFVETIEETREAMAPFRAHVEHGGAEYAEEEGYENTETHVFTEEGLYGVPFHRGSEDGLDLERPPILLYRMTDLWYYELLGAEWYVPVDAVDEPPELFGQRFHDPMPGHGDEIDQPEHYGLHVWLYRANPEGLFALYNPAFR